MLDEIRKSKIIEDIDNFTSSKEFRNDLYEEYLEPEKYATENIHRFNSLSEAYEWLDDEVVNE